MGSCGQLKRFIEITMCKLVILDYSNTFFLELLQELMPQIGKLLVDPHFNYLKKCRFCMSWDTSCKLHKENFARHC